MEKLKMQTKDLTEENIKKLTSLFPELITEVEKEGKLIKTINVDKLKELVGDYAENSEELYQLTWAGKQRSRQKIVTPISKTLRPVKEDSVDFENTENLYIEGDNFEVLKLLQESYLNKVKCIYIDPPYNTGNDFVYKDDFKTSKEEYDEESGSVDEEGNKLFKNTTTNGRFHSDWLSMMYERLVLAKDLLRDDGVIFISIDDNEVDNLRKVCDEIFGESNFIAQLPTIMNLKGNNDEFGFAGTHEYTIVYSKYKDSLDDLNGLPVNDDEKKDYSEKDEIGYYKQGATLMRTGEAGGREQRPKGYYPIYVSKEGNIDIVRNSNTDVEIYPRTTTGKEMSWRRSKETLIKTKNEIIVKKVGDSYSFYKKQRLDNDLERGKKAKTLFYKPEYSSGNGTSLMKNLFEGRIFNNPKPLSLIKDLIIIGTNKDDIILDFFSGSATTAHAVMQLNAEYKGNRKFIMVQLPEETDEKSEAYKAGYKNICEIGKERIRRAGKKIKEETNADIDYGFKVFRIDSSNMKDVYYNPTEVKQTKLFQMESNIKEDRSELDILYQVLLDLAIPIDAKVHEEKINNRNIFKVNEDYLVACFADDIDLDTVKEIVKLKPLNIVFKDLSFKDDATKINVHEYIKNKLPNTTVRVI